MDLCVAGRVVLLKNGIGLGLPIWRSMEQFEPEGIELDFSVFSFWELIVP